MIFLVNVKNPVKVAKKVLESRHCFFAGEGANRFATANGFSTVPPDSLVSKFAVRALKRAKEGDSTITNEIGQEEEEEDDLKIRSTVGAVAIDRDGNLAAATSTGGMTNKMKGRIGDTPIVGAGNYAENKLGQTYE